VRIRSRVGRGAGTEAKIEPEMSVGRGRFIGCWPPAAPAICEEAGGAPPTEPGCGPAGGGGCWRWSGAYLQYASAISTVWSGARSFRGFVLGWLSPLEVVEERRGEGGEKESEEGGRPACKAWTWRPSWSVQRAFFWEIGPLANRLPTGPDWRLGWPIWMNFSFELASDVDWERNQS
jgi:hypothetical protein